MTRPTVWQVPLAYTEQYCRTHPAKFAPPKPLPWWVRLVRALDRMVKR